MSAIEYTVREWEDVPPVTNWLTKSEQSRLQRFRFEKRRNDWLLGRWAAKNAILHIEKLPVADIARIEIPSAPSGAPQAFLDGEALETGISLSHSHARALCVVSHDVLLPGCDIELVEMRRPAFVETFFTDSERQLVDDAEPSARDTLVTMIWSAKESTLKALGTGLKVDTRSIEVTPTDDPVSAGWNTVDVVTSSGEMFTCFWRLDGQFVLSVSATISAMSRTHTLSSSLATRTASSIMIMQKEQPTAIVSAPVSFA